MFSMTATRPTPASPRLVERRPRRLPSVSRAWRWLRWKVLCGHLTMVRVRSLDGRYWFKCWACGYQVEAISQASQTKVRQG